jgi:hypothetical protein
MENENRSKEPIGRYIKSNDIVITRSQLKKITLGLFALICIFLIVMYFTSGLSRKKASEVFVKYWKERIIDIDNELENNNLKNVEIKEIKKIKADTYLVKVDYIQEVGTRIPKTYSYSEYLKEKRIYEEFLKENGLSRESFTEEEFFKATTSQKKSNKKWKWQWELGKHSIDLVYTKLDTGWFIEEKKK